MFTNSDVMEAAAMLVDVILLRTAAKVKTKRREPLIPHVFPTFSCWRRHVFPTALGNS
jgi:hypothetical protein